MRQDNQPLFRKEALGNLATDVGRPLPTGRLPYWVITASACGIAVATAMIIATSHYNHRERLSGTLEPKSGLLQVIAPRSGRVIAVFKSEDDIVKAGDPILSVSMDPITVAGASLSSRLDAAQLREASALSQEATAHTTSIRAEISELIAKRSGLTSQLERDQADLQDSESRLVIQQRTLHSFQTLFLRSYVSHLQLAEKEDNVLQAQQALSGIKRDREAAASGINQIDAQIRHLRADGNEAVAQLGLARAQLQEKVATSSADATINLVAPAAGRLVYAPSKIGQEIAAGAVTATILPHGSTLEAELLAPSRSIGFIEKGDLARLMFDAFPYQRFGTAMGTVIRVASAPVGTLGSGEYDNSKEPMFRVQVQLKRQTILAYGRKWPLDPGMKVSADIVTRSVPLLQWLFDPLFAFKGR